MTNAEDVGGWSDQRLAEGIFERDEAALGWVLKTLDGFAQRWVRRQGSLPDRPGILAERARDRAQDKILARIETFKFDSKLTSWMQRIFIREVLQLLRSYAGSVQQLPAADGRPQWVPIQPLDELTKLAASTPASAQEPSAAVLALRNCLERLSPADREVVLTLLLDTPDAALAAQLEITPAALRQRRHRALLRFKDCFLTKMPAFG